MADLRFHRWFWGALWLAALAAIAVPAGAAAIALAAPDEGGGAARGAVYVLSILSKNATQKVDPSSANKSAMYIFQVQNTGDGDLPDCVLTLTPWNFPPGKWSYNFIPSCPFRVAHGETKQVILVIYPAADAEAKRYTFAIRGANNVIANSININLDILQWGDVQVIAPPSQLGDPGDTLEFGFEIKNTGNGKDKFYIVSIETSIATMQPYLKDNNNYTIDLAAGKSVVKTVAATLPWGLGTTEGSGGIQLTLTARSAFNNSQEDANWTFIHVHHIYDLGLGVLPPNASVLPGQLAEFNLTLLNLGNGPDNITLDLAPSFDLSGWAVSLGNSRFNLSAGRLGTTRLRITPPFNALMGDYKLELAARSSGPPFPELPVERTEPIAIAIRQVKKLEAAVTSQTAPSPIAPGEVVRFGFNFTNKGNGEDTVNITVVEKPQNWHASLDFSQNIRLQPYVTQEVSLTVQASVNRNESLFQTYYVKLQVVNSDKTSVLNFTFAIPVGPVYDWEFVVEEPTRGLVNPYANPVHSFSLVFSNAGNTGDEVQLVLGGEYASWGKLDTQALSLAYGERKQVRLAVEVPQTAEVGRDYGLRITATSQNNPSLVKEFSVSVAIVHMDMSVVPVGSLEINNQVWKDYKTTQGTRLNISVTVRNDGTDSVRGVNVKFYDNDAVFAERNTSTIAPLKTARITVQWEALSPGPHVITARADPGGLLPETNESNNEARAVVNIPNPINPGPPPPGQNWALVLGALCALGAAVGVAYAVVRRRPSYDRELYESIYGPTGRR